MRNKNRKHFRDHLLSILALVLSAAVMVCGILPVFGVSAADASYAEDRAALARKADQVYPVIEASAAASNIEKHGNIVLLYADGDLTLNVLNDFGYEYGDIVTITIGEQKIDMPICGTYLDVDHMQPVLSAKDSRTAKIGLNMGDFVTTYGIATKTEDEKDGYRWTFRDGLSDPAVVTISMKEKGGYLNEYQASHLLYTDVRSDYADLTDEEFANFREIRTTGIRPGVLYRSATPVDNRHNRNTYADKAFKKAGVNIVMNLADPDDGVKNHAGYEGSYYSTTNYIALDMGLDYTSEEFGSKLAEGLRFFAANKGIYAVHCMEGKDRTGVVCALIECFMGATYEEVKDDYMKTFYNYYTVRPETELYSLIVRRGIDTILQNLFGVSDLAGADLASEAEQYFKEIGLTDSQLAALRDNLGVKKEQKIRNPLAIRAKTYRMSFSRLKKKSRTLKKSAVIKFVKKGKGTIRYSVISAKKGSKSYSKYFRISSETGTLNVKKGLKKGTYRIRIKVSASGTQKYKSASKTATFKLIIR